MKMKPKAIGPVRAAILSWFGVYGTDYLYTDGIGANSPAGVPVDQDRVLSLSAVWACARLISETIATLPLNMFERTSAGKRVAQQHPLQFIIHDQPNTDSTAAVFWEAAVAAMLLRGNAHAERLMVGARLVGLMFLDPKRLAITRDGQGLKEYRYTNDNGTQRVIPRERIWTIPGFSLDGKCGVSVIRYGATVFGSALAADTAASSTFANGLLPRVWFKYPKVLNPQQREEARDNTIARLSGAINAAKPAILENGMEVGTVGINPDDAQLLDALDGQYSFELPATLVEQEFNAIWGQVEAEMKSAGKTFEDEDTTEEKARAEYRKIAERRVRLGLVLSKFGEREKVQVNEQELQRALIERARQFPGQEKAVFDYYRKDANALASLQAPVFEEKVVDVLLGLVKVTDKTVSKDELFKEDEEIDI